MTFSPNLYYVTVLFKIPVNELVTILRFSKTNFVMFLTSSCKLLPVYEKQIER